jgi:hypothetical protein
LDVARDGCREEEGLELWFWGKIFFYSFNIVAEADVKERVCLVENELNNKRMMSIIGSLPNGREISPILSSRALLRLPVQSSARLAGVQA